MRKALCLPTIVSASIVTATLFTSQLVRQHSKLRVQGYGTISMASLKHAGFLLGKSNELIAIGGHRGSGMNLPPSSAVVFRENTIKSFLKAVEDGATFVEFDVQVSSDGVPVIWHDDFIIHGTQQSAQQTLCKDLTAAQFKQLRPTLLRGGKLKGNVEAWSALEDDELPTLEEVFEALPEHVGLDVEVKMTTGPEVVQTPPEEIERMLGPILATVERCMAGSSRTLVFTSFDPDVCAELKRRCSYPVMFLSGAGEYMHMDPRRTSMAAAVEVAEKLGLEGVVVYTNRVRQHPEQFSAALAKGLKVMTYGLANSDPKWAAEQQRLGVHAVIADDIPGLMAGLLAA